MRGLQQDLVNRWNGCVPVALATDVLLPERVCAEFRRNHNAALGKQRCQKTGLETCTEDEANISILLLQDRPSSATDIRPNLTVDVEAGHDEERSVARTQIVSVDDVLVSSDQVLVSKWNRFGPSCRSTGVEEEGDVLFVRLPTVADALEVTRAGSSAVAVLHLSSVKVEADLVASHIVVDLSDSDVVLACGLHSFRVVLDGTLVNQQQL